MLKVLLKKQMVEVFRGYFFNSKKKKMRSKGEIIFKFGLYAFLMVIVLGGTFASVAVALCSGLAPVNMGWLYFAIMSGIAIALGTFGSVFSTYSGLYLPKDNDLLLSMPIPVRLIIVSRLINVYLLGLMFSAVVMLPTLIIWWLFAGANILNVICGILLFVIISLIVLMLSCLLGWVVAKISLKLKNKSYITVLISLLFFAAYYLVYFKAQSLIKDMIANADAYGENIKSSVYALYLFGKIGEGDLICALLFSAITALLLALVIFILSRGFLKLASPGGSTPKVKYREKSVKKKSVFSALLGKEFARFTSSPNYMLNCGLGILMMPALGIFLLIKGGEFVQAIRSVFPDMNGIPELILCTALMLISTMNDMAAPSVSLEGKSVWLPQSLPVKASSVLMAKTTMQLILTEIPLLFAAICAVLAARASVLDSIMLCVTPIMFSVFSAFFATFSGVRNPIMEWTNEVFPIKQSGAVLLALFGGWGFVALFTVPYVFISKFFSLSLYLAIWSAIYLAAAILLYRWLNTKGAESFSRL